jgi:hypothetical protein
MEKTHLKNMQNESELNSRRGILDQFLVKLLAFVREFIEVDIQLWDQFDQGVDTAFGIQELIQHNHPCLFEDAVAALEGAPFIADFIIGFAQNIFQFI